MRIRLLLIAAVMLSVVAGAPADAAAPSTQRDDVWVGQVVRHNSHFDYQGSACPASAEMCIKILAKYRIVPLTPQAARGLRKAAGGQAELVGYRGPAGDEQHNATLYVRRVGKP